MAVSFCVTRYYGDMRHSEVPDHVRDAFHVAAHEPELLDSAWDYGWKVGGHVFSQVVLPDRAAFSARVREKLQVDGVRVVRPVRSSDGRFINDGWRCSGFEPGSLSRRVDEVVAAALRLDVGLREVPIPDSWYRGALPGDPFYLADRLLHVLLEQVSGEVGAQRRDFVAVLARQGFVLDDELPRHRLAAVLIPKLMRLVRDVDVPVQVTHADMFGTTILSGAQVPVVTDLVGVAQPGGFSAALVIVDALLLEVADEKLIHRFMHVPHLSQLLLRALLYRTLVHAAHSESKSNTGTNLEWVASLVMSSASATL